MRTKKWIVYDRHGNLAGWFGCKDVAQGFADEIGGSIQLVFV